MHPCPLCKHYGNWRSRIWLLASFTQAHRYWNTHINCRLRNCMHTQGICLVAACTNGAKICMQTKQEHPDRRGHSHRPSRSIGIGDLSNSFNTDWLQSLEENSRVDELTTTLDCYGPKLTLFCCSWSSSLTSTIQSKQGVLRRCWIVLFVDGEHALCLHMDSNTEYTLECKQSSSGTHSRLGNHHRAHLIRLSGQINTDQRDRTVRMHLNGRMDDGTVRAGRLAKQHSAMCGYVVSRLLAWSWPWWWRCLR